MKHITDKKLRIVFLDFDDIKNPLLGAGQAKATLEVGKRLAEKGHLVTVLCSRYPGYEDRKENGIKYVHIGLGTSNIRLNNLGYIFSIPLTVRNIKNADIIVECFTAPISTLLSPLFTKIPVVGLPTSFEAERFAKLYHLPFDKVEKFGLKQYKYFLPYTKYFEQKMKQVNQKVISKIVPEGVGAEFFKIKQKNPKHILFLGRFDIGQKGIDLLLRSYQKIAKDINYPLMMAGYGPDESKIKSLVKELGLEKQVIFTGKTFGAKKEKLLSESLYVAFPSRHEGFSLFSLEALAAGLPLVGFNIPGLSWTNSGIALKAKKFSINEYSKLLLKATDKNIIGKMREEARIFAKKYTWENVANNFEQFFNLALKIERIN